MTYFIKVLGYISVVYSENPGIPRIQGGGQGVDNPSFEKKGGSRVSFDPTFWEDKL